METNYAWSDSQNSGGDAKMVISVREAVAADVAQIVALVQMLARSIGEDSPITPSYVARYLAAPGCHVLLAEEGGAAIGLLCYSLRPNLYHAGLSGLVEELIVDGARRGRGVGDHLLTRALEEIAAAGAKEVSVSTGPDNEGAIRFYRAHGLVDESLLLEKHFLP